MTAILFCHMWTDLSRFLLLLDDTAHKGDLITILLKPLISVNFLWRIA
ncbi:hypothetical protein [Oculatella sp. LEGE 06141]